MGIEEVIEEIEIKVRIGLSYIKGITEDGRVLHLHDYRRVEEPYMQLDLFTYNGKEYGTMPILYVKK